MDNATFQIPQPQQPEALPQQPEALPESNAPGNPEVPEAKIPKSRHKTFWVVSVLVVAGLAIGLVFIFGKTGLYKGLIMQTEDQPAPSLAPVSTTAATKEQRAAGNIAIKAVSEVKAAADEAEQASQEAADHAAKAEEFAAKAEEAKTPEEAASFAAEAERYTSEAKNARDRAFAASIRASDARNRARSAAQDAGINADEFLASSGADDAASDANSSVGEAQASVRRAEQSASQARQIADERTQQAAEEKQPAGEEPAAKEKEVSEKPVEGGIVAVGPAIVPTEKQPTEKLAAGEQKDAGEVPVPGEKPAEGEQFTGFFQFLQNEAKNLSTQEERQKAINILSAAQQAAQEGRVEDAKELLKQAENFIKSSKAKAEDEKLKKEAEKAKKEKESPAIVAVEPPQPGETAEEQQLRNEVNSLTQLYREAIANNAAQADQYRQQLEIALAALQQQTGQPVSVTVQLPQQPAVSCPTGFTYDASRNVCVQAQTQEVIVSRVPSAGAGGTAAQGGAAAQVVLEPSRREVALGKTPSTGVQAEEEETAQTQELAQAAAAAKPSARIASADAEAGLRGAYVEGRIAGESGPGLLIYPAILAGANLLYYLRKRKKK